MWTVSRHAVQVGCPHIASRKSEPTFGMRLLPHAEETYWRGGTVQFGRVQLNWQDLSTGGNVLPWNELGEVDVYNGIVAIKEKETGRNWLYAPLQETPNVCVLEALIDSILETGEGEPI